MDDVKTKMKIQKLLDDNLIRAGGDFHSDELDESNFIYDFKKCFKISTKEGDENSYKLLEKIIKSSTVRVRGMISSKELKQSKFFKELFNSFEIEML